MLTSDAPPAEEATHEPTAATRHLCTGVYVDERFRDLVINEVCTAPYRRVAPSYGFDVVPVMHHAWRAAALSALLRLTLVGAVAAPTLAGALPTAVLITCGLSLLWLLHRAVLLLGTDREPRPKRKPKRRGLASARDDQRLSRLLSPRKNPERSRALRRIGVAALSLALTGLLMALTHPGQATMALCVAAGITLMCLSIGSARQLMLNHILRAPTLRPARLSGRQRAADAQQGHVCAVYRRPRHSEDDDEDDITMFTLFGDESPFIGAGELVYQWNPPMSIQLLRPGDDDDAPLHEREHPVPPFQAHELVEYLREAVQPLDADSQDVRLPAQVRDRVYIAETDVAVDHSLLPQEVTEKDLRVIINTPGSKQHHFLEVTTPAEGSEFVATVLLHISLQGRTLSISTVACVLAHTPRSFQRTEEFGHHGAAAVVWAAFRELATLPSEIQRSWRVASYLFALCKAAVLPRDLTSAPIRNVLIGSRVSIRERPSQAWSKIQLEKSDILGRMKTIERRLLRAAGDFLSARDVDISEFNDRALKIINSGIFNFGDNNSFSNNAVGDAAQVSVSANQSAGPNSSGGGSQ
ncbi:hypothetical protein [Streptomyces melanogenes]|uniref:hypothetical protein n=1 Tax=Streptomyces melanogenes TaxID=67326 RepID=UPI00167E2268|nr:hypothetical protein [Streptomyces melanogenes]GGP82226.1 hypothetical protein GCM10010278_71030 [Streptomyces melanogenes]